MCNVVSVVLCLVVPVFGLNASEVHDTTSFAIYFRSAVSVIEPGYRNNASTLDAATKSLHSVVYDKTLEYSRFTSSVLPRLREQRSSMRGWPEPGLRV